MYFILRLYFNYYIYYNIFYNNFRLQHYTDYMPFDDPIPEYIGYIPEIDLGRPINFKSPSYIIAEIGQNHQGDIMMAKKLIKLAKVNI